VKSTKEIWAVFELLPVLQARAKSVSASVGKRTSRITVFTIYPFDVSLEGGKELDHAIKDVAGFPVPEVPMIALARFVVVPGYTDAPDHIGKPVLLGVRRSW